MPFPRTDRVHYGKNPLAEVICQLRFPPLLQIAAEPPAKFQGMVREQLPLFAEKPDAFATIGLQQMGLPPEVLKLVQERMPLPAGVTFDFKSADMRWCVGLSRDSISLTDSKYVRWEDFSAQLRIPLDALQRIYKPAFFLRVGLRYRNTILRSKLGLADVSWGDLLKPHIAAELANSDVANATTDVTTQLTVRLMDAPGNVRILHGLGQARFANGQQEEVYIIDADFFSEGQIGLDEASSHLDGFHEHAGWLFRWCISDRLHEAMEPRKL